MANLLNHKDLRDFLNRLDEEDSKKLAVTTTQNLIKLEDISSKEDAIDMILRHSPDVMTILNRKIIRRDMLFRYLNENGIAILESVTKLGLITKTIKHWEENAKNFDVPPETEVSTINQSNDSLKSKVTELANKYSEWFYKIMNENEPIGEEHFFEDCVLKLNLISDSLNVSECVEKNPKEVVELLFKTKCDHGLYFNPNLTNDGTRGKMDSHGLVMVFACGTLHTKESIVGVFEQMFALARDPFADNSWKIKNTTLNLRSQTVTNVPVLQDSSPSYELALQKS